MTLVIVLWAEELRNRRVVVFSDNESVVQMVNCSSARCPNSMTLICIINYDNNTRFFVKHVPGKENKLADLLSRNKLSEVFKLAPKDMSCRPQELPNFMWPVEKLWDSYKRGFNLVNFN